MFRFRLPDIYNKTDRLITFVLISGLIVSIPFFLSHDRETKTGGAEIYFNNPPTSIPVGQTQEVEIDLQTLGQSVNAVGLVLHYNPNIVDLLNMTTAQSFCTFYTENSFDTIKGEVDLDCGAPNPGISGDSTLLILTMRGKAIGQTTLTFDPKQTMVLANDGKGTELLKGELPKLTLNVTQTF